MERAKSYLLLMGFWAKRVAALWPKWSGGVRGDRVDFTTL
jgi:hypothetical protein